MAPTREYFVVHYDLRMRLDSDQADCLRLFPSRDDAEVAAERSANEAMHRYWWGTAYEDDKCTEKTNEEGERQFVCKAEQHESTFVLRKMTATVVGSGEGQFFAYGIVANKLLGGTGELEFPSTVDHGCVFVGADKEAVKGAAIERARAFAQELSAHEPTWFESDPMCNEADILVIKEGEGYARARQPRQEGSDACLTLRIETALDPECDYEGDGVDTSDYCPCTCATIEVVELPIGKPDNDFVGSRVGCFVGYESKEFFKEWTKFPKAATPEMERKLKRKREENTRRLEEAIERSRQPRESREMPWWRAAYLEEMRRRRETGEASVHHQRRQEAGLAGGVERLNVEDNAQDGS